MSSRIVLIWSPSNNPNEVTPFSPFPSPLTAVISPYLNGLKTGAAGQPCLFVDSASARYHMIWRKNKENILTRRNYSMDTKWIFHNNMNRDFFFKCGLAETQDQKTERSQLSKRRCLGRGSFDWVMGFIDHGPWVISLADKIANTPTIIQGNTQEKNPSNWFHKVRAVNKSWSRNM
jgi:hypothetical protein